MVVKMLSKHFSNEEEMLVFAGQFAKQITPGIVIYLEGPLGAGKTTFSRGFLRGFGYAGKVKSPTYTLVEPYEFPHQTIYHFDLYRLQDPHELEEIGIDEYFTAESICLIEWPDKGVPLLPAADLTCVLSFAEEGRDMQIKAHTPRGEKILKNISLMIK